MQEKDWNILSDILELSFSIILLEYSASTAFGHFIPSLSILSPLHYNCQHWLVAKHPSSIAVATLYLLAGLSPPPPNSTEQLGRPTHGAHPRRRRLCLAVRRPPAAVQPGAVLGLAAVLSQIWSFLLSFSLRFMRFLDGPLVFLACS